MSELSLKCAGSREDGDLDQAPGKGSENALFSCSELADF
jgi:hypothetical protein